MAVPDHEPVSSDAFLRWVGTKDDRFELVDGRIVRMTAGARQSHNVGASNILVALSPRAKRAGCRTTASDTAARTGPHGVRCPGVAVDCGPGDPTAVEASRPTLVVEVASPGASAMDATDKLDEYQAHPDIRPIMFVDPDGMSVKIHRLDGHGAWQVEKHDDRDHVVELPEIGASRALRDIYDTSDPAPPSRLRLVEEAEARAGPR